MSSCEIGDASSAAPDWKVTSLSMAGSNVKSLDSCEVL